MRRFLIALAAAVPLSFALAAPAQAGPVYVEVTEATGQKVPGQYIVTLDSDAKVTPVANSLAADPLYTYHAALHGFAAKLSPAQVRALQRNPNVERI